jgi:hypothetical protein
MESKTISQVGMIQTGIVVLGYLAATAAIKVGYGNQPDFAGRPTAASVEFIRTMGLLPIIAPVLWVLFALLLKDRKKPNRLLDSLPVISGVALILILLFGYIYGTAEGFFGPPIMDIQAL